MLPNSMKEEEIVSIQKNLKLLNLRISGNSESDIESFLELLDSSESIKNINFNLYRKNGTHGRCNRKILHLTIQLD